MRAWTAVGAMVLGAVVLVGLGLRPRGDPPVDPPADPPTPVAREVVDAASPPGSVDDTAAYHASQLVADAGREAAAGRFAQAHALLDQAYAQDPQPATLLALARVEERLGRCREAKRATQRVLAASPTGALADEATRLLGRLGRCD
jgi:tetratricopeptide (TPR) repeat protein